MNRSMKSWSSARWKRCRNANRSTKSWSSAGQKRCVAESRSGERRLARRWVVVEVTVMDVT